MRERWAMESGATDRSPAEIQRQEIVDLTEDHGVMRGLPGRRDLRRSYTRSRLSVISLLSLLRQDFFQGTVQPILQCRNPVESAID
jgi:hypothetical protein